MDYALFLSSYFLGLAAVVSLLCIKKKDTNRYFFLWISFFPASASAAFLLALLSPAIGGARASQAGLALFLLAAATFLWIGLNGLKEPRMKIGKFTVFFPVVLFGMFLALTGEIDWAASTSFSLSLLTAAGALILILAKDGGGNTHKVRLMALGIACMSAAPNYGEILFMLSSGPANPLLAPRLMITVIGTISWLYAMWLWYREKVIHSWTIRPDSVFEKSLTIEKLIATTFFAILVIGFLAVYGLTDSMDGNEHRKLMILGVFFLSLVALGAFAIHRYFFESSLRLAESEERLTTAMEGGGAFPWHYQKHSDLIHIRGDLLSKLGVGTINGDGVTLVDFQSVLEPESRARFQNQWDQFICGEMAELDLVLQILIQGKPSIFVRVKGRRLLRSTLADEKFAGTFQDITDRFRDQRQLKLIGTAIESTANAVIITDAKGQIEWVNPAFTETTGYPAEEVIGKNPNLLKSGRHPPAFYRELWTTLRAGKTWTGELINRRRNGEIFTEEAVITPVRPDGETITHFVAVKQDVSDERAMRRIVETERANLEKINDGLLSMTEDYEANINSLVTLAGEIFGADSALYNRLEGEQLHTVGAYQAPPDLPRSDLAQGHLCLEVIRKKDRFLYVSDLPSTPFAESDPNVKAYGLKTYAGHSVEISGQPIGSICVVFTREYAITGHDRECLSLIAQALGREEVLARGREKLDRLAKDESEARARVSTLLEQLNDAVLVEDSDRKIVFANPAFEKTFGVPVDHVLGADCGELATQSAPYFLEPERFLRANEDAIRFETPIHGEIFALQDGRHLSRNFSPIRKGTEKIGYLWQYRDVTAAQVNRMLLSAVAELARCVLDRPLDSAESWSDAAEALGSRIDVDRVYVFRNHPHSEDGSLACSQIAEWVQKGIEPQLDNPELQDIRYDGSGLERWADSFRMDLPIYGRVRDFPQSERDILEPQDILSIVVVPIRVRATVWGFIGFDSCRRTRVWEKEEISLLRSTAALIGSRLELQESLGALSRSEEKFRAMFETSPVGMALSRRADHSIIEANEAFSKMLGYDSKDLRNLTFNELTPRRWGEFPLSEPVNSSPANSGPTEREFFRRDGSKISAIVDGMGFRGAGGEELEWTIIQDISQRKKWENELRVAKETADSANRAKSTFLATMSHEIRTPLNAVIGMSSLLSQTPLQEDQKSYAQIIVSAGETLLDLINDILDYSKIEAGRIELEEVDFNLSETIFETLSMIERTAAEKDVELVYYLDPNLPEVFLGDRIRLKQIILNLLSNAVKFTDEGEVALRIERMPVKGSTTRLRFSVSDTGIGVSPEAIQQLFKPFQQADSSITRNYGGTGLGLAISQRLAEVMGGRIEVESHPGRGSTFSFEISLSDGSRTVRLAAVPLLESVRGKRALIVDDNSTNRRFLEDQCRLWAMKTQSAANSEEALALLAENEDWDVLMIDYHMSGIDGAELAREIDQRFPKKRIPKILLSSAYETREAELRQLFDAFVPKPIRPHLLLQTLGGTGAEMNPSEEHRTTRSSKPLRILVAEDNAVNRRVLSALLNSIGEEALMVEDGESAVKQAEAEAFDLILMDIQMPVMDGFQATRTIRLSEGSTKHTRIVALTANASKEDRDQCMDAGFDDYVAKPIKIDGIKKLIQEARDARESGGDRAGCERDP